jgi:hypothetical protein
VDAIEDLLLSLPALPLSTIVQRSTILPLPDTAPRRC